MKKIKILGILPQDSQFCREGLGQNFSPSEKDFGGLVGEVWDAGRNFQWDVGWKTEHKCKY